MSSSLSLALTAAALAIGDTGARAQTPYQQTFEGLNLTVPDGTTVGVRDTRTLPAGLGSILEVRVTLLLSGGYTGDLYASLTHNGISSVLLNRPGRRPGDVLGYADSGLNVTFADGAPSDVHNYRVIIAGNHASPLGGGLDGLWQPDGRAEAPGTVVDSTPRSAFLSKFNGQPLDGAWTLFIADLSPVGEAKLEGWSLNIVPVPEPLTGAAGIGLGILAWALWRRSEADGR